MSTLRLLGAGERDLNLYGDGSFYEQLGLGAWAYRIPTLGIGGVGVEPGSYVECFEFAAVVAGVEAVASIDATERPIHIHTDSEFVLILLKHLTDAVPLPSRSRFERARELFMRVSASIGAPRVVHPKRKAQR